MTDATLAGEPVYARPIVVPDDAILDLGVAAPTPAGAYRELAEEFGIPDGASTSRPDARIIALQRQVASQEILVSGRQRLDPEVRHALQHVILRMRCLAPLELGVGGQHGEPHLRRVVRDAHLPPGISEEEPPTFLIAGEHLGKDFDRDLSSEIRVGSAIHLAHAAGADLSGDFVWTDAATRRQRQ